MEKVLGVNFHGTSFDLGFIALSNLNVSNHLKQVSTKTLKCLANCSKLPSTGNCRTNKNSQSKGLASKPTTTLKISFCTWIKTERIGSCRDFLSENLHKSSQNGYQGRASGLNSRARKACHQLCNWYHCPMNSFYEDHCTRVKVLG